MPAVQEQPILDEDLLQWFSCFIEVVGSSRDGSRKSGFSLNGMRALPMADVSHSAFQAYSGLRKSMLKVSSSDKVALALASSTGPVNGRWSEVFANAMPQERIKEIKDFIEKEDEKKKSGERSVFEELEEGREGVGGP